jgi:hypothetical protein
MGRPKKKDVEKVDKGIEDNKKAMEEAKANNGVNITDILTTLSNTPAPVSDSKDGPDHLPIHTLNDIKKELSKKVVKQDDDGNDILAPLYNEEQKANVIFAMLAERGINLLDHLENCLAEVGYNTNVVMSINETMGKVADLMNNIGENQYRKAKLENERTHLEIQKYKADLKKREIEIKEQVAQQGPGNTNVIAVGSTSELLEIMSGNKGAENIVEVPEREDNGEVEE